MTERRPIAAGNWKMNLRTSEAKAFSRALRARLHGDEVEVLLFPAFTLVPVVAEILVGSAARWGGQDLHPAELGAHTGDVSGWHLADHGCDWVLVGHSERRRDHGEDDAVVASKVARAAACGLRPVLCVGETLDERRAGRTFDVLGRQLAAALPGAPDGFVLAYEPVWAIGTGETATPDQAQAAHDFLRQRLSELADATVGDATRILYGGSVKPTNASDLATLPDVDGFLVGGASLDVDDFLNIIASLR